MAGDRDRCGRHLFTTEDTFACYDNKTSSVEGIHLTLRIWKSIMRVFDSEVAHCTIKQPLFLHPHVSTERWFELRMLMAVAPLESIGRY